MGFSRQEYWNGLPFPSQGIFLTQGLNPGLQHCRQMLYPLSHQGTKDWAELAGCGPAHPPPETGRQGSQSQKGTIVAPERNHPPNCKQAPLLTKTPWNSGWSTSARKVAARDQLPRGDTQHTWKGAPIVHPENQAAGTGEVISCSLPSTWSPELLGWGRAQNAGPIKSAPLWSTWEPEPERLRTRKCTQPRTCLRQFLAEQPRAWAV